MSVQVRAVRRPAMTAGLAILGVVVALVLVWRVVVTGTWALSGGRDRSVDERATATSAETTPDRLWRAQLARNPTDYVALVALALVLERQGRTDDARAAMNEALRLAPSDAQVLLDVAAFHLRQGDEAQAMPILLRAADLHPELRANVWPVLTQWLDGGRHVAALARVAGERPTWWPMFFSHACAKSTNVAALQQLLAVRAAQGTDGIDESRCLIGRLQRENLWAQAYQVWINALPSAQRERIGYVFNGDFESPLSNLGFDWTTPPQDNVGVETLPVLGMGGRRALRVEFVDKRWSGPPIQQTLMLVPGRYRLEGRGRTEGLDTWLGVQWALYCPPHGLPQVNDPPRQLARSGRFLGTSAWEAIQAEFTVPGNCPVQTLRLELANPRRDADAPGNVAARLRGTAWFDDFRVRSVD